MATSSSGKTPREIAVDSMGSQYLQGGIAFLGFWGIGFILAPFGLGIAVLATILLAVKLLQETKRREALIEGRLGAELQTPVADLARTHRSSVRQVDEHGNAHARLAGAASAAEEVSSPSGLDFSSGSDLFKHHGPAVNIDGTPMMGDSGVDIRGNPFGVTSSLGSSGFSNSSSDAFGGSSGGWSGSGSDGMGGL